MKLILVLLACAAVTNAYSYSYWCAHNFNIHPSSYCLHYNVRFNRAWCSSYFYSNILKVYPGEGCGKKGWKEKSVSDITNEMSTLLKSELNKITKKLNDAKTIWLNNVISVHGQFSTEFERYITIYYKALISTPNADKAGLIAERNRKIAEYKQKLQDLRNTALAEYSKAITAKINLILQYHQKLVKGATDCLNTRNQKLQEFQMKIVEMSKQKVHKFLVEKLALAAKNVQAYKASLTKLFGPFSSIGFVVSQITAISNSFDVVFAGTNKNWYQAWKVADVVGQYNSQEKSKVLSEMAKYFLHLLKHYARVYQNYVCSYRCYMSTGHFNYYSHHYRRYYRIIYN
ncbi:unnamed protein product [Clavelina lepadiformis]|uniref:Uncharacterized protein n=1 Tax=Clavelina lepadiformis TaxID=159417 RepID=A0ABP0FQ95_CLALP